MSKRKRARRKPEAIHIMAATMVVIGLAILGGLLAVQQVVPHTGPTLRETDTAFSIPTHVGQPAPEFIALGVDGQPYTFTPGDGRPKAIVFYMGFR